MEGLKITPELITHVTIVAIALMIFWFLLKPARKAKVEIDADTACTNDYNAVLLRLASCCTLEMCAKLDQEIETFFDIYYESATKELIDNYYVDLITRLTDIKIKLRNTSIEQG